MVASGLRAVFIRGGFFAFLYCISEQSFVFKCFDVTVSSFFSTLFTAGVNIHVSLATGTIPGPKCCRVRHNSPRVES